MAVRQNTMIFFITLEMLRIYLSRIDELSSLFCTEYLCSSCYYPTHSTIILKRLPFDHATAPQDKRRRQLATFVLDL